MTSADRRALARYIRRVADEMELRDWKFEVSDEPPDNPDFQASCVCTPSRKYAVIAFSDAFKACTPEEQRQCVVHELLHAHHEVCWQMVRSDLIQPLGQETYNIFCDSYRRAMEYTVDACAEALARHMPLFDWPKASAKPTRP